MVADAPFASVNDAGFNTPFGPSAATVCYPTVTGSKNNSCNVPPGAVTVTVQADICIIGLVAAWNVAVTAASYGGRYRPRQVADAPSPARLRTRSSGR